MSIALPPIERQDPCGSLSLIYLRYDKDRRPRALGWGWDLPRRGTRVTQLRIPYRTKVEVISPIRRETITSIERAAVLP